MSDDRTRRVLLANVSDIDTTLIPPGTQYGATLGKAQQRIRLIYAVFANLCKSLQPMNYHS
jgi:hypothetical protein